MELYRVVAQDFLPLIKHVDAKAIRMAGNPHVRGLSADQRFVEQTVGSLIKKTDEAGISGMLLAIKLESEIDPICEIYARLVLGHEGESSCDGVIADLISAGLRVREKTCRKEG